MAFVQRTKKEATHPGARPTLSAPATGQRRVSTWTAMRRSWQAYALLAPIFFLLIVFGYYPPLLGLVRAFYRWRPGIPATYVGLENFTSYFSYAVTPTELGNMVKLLGFGLLVGVVVPFVMAELIFFVRSPAAKEFYRLLVIIPMLVPGIVTILLWQKMYDPQLGPINDLLRTLGLEGLAHNWLGEPATALYAIMFVGFPWVWGVGTLIYLGGLGQISKSVYEAAALDGCTGLRRLYQIDLPLVLGQVRLLAILAVIHAITSFQNILVLTNGGPGFATMVPGLSMYHSAFRGQQFGYSSAIGLMLFIVAMTGTIIINRSIRPTNEELAR
ncbi:MAG: sugar ABC transporter permease [Caldilinea sp. CFX5]|nr:sugar ABC transporter permease [Caldilinea sp. CFX5]